LISGVGVGQKIRLRLLRTLDGTLVIRESARFDNNDSEPKSKVRLLFLLSLS